MGRKCTEHSTLILIQLIPRRVYDNLGSKSTLKEAGALIYTSHRNRLPFPYFLFVIPSFFGVITIITIIATVIP